jgi:hypothetical protein
MFPETESGGTGADEKQKKKRTFEAKLDAMKREDDGESLRIVYL